MGEAGWCLLRFLCFAWDKTEKLGCPLFTPNCLPHSTIQTIHTPRFRIIFSNNSPSHLLLSFFMQSTQVK